jgi:hypothetical protein
MEWIFLESLVALAVLVFIVWWTMRAARSRDSATHPQHEPEDRAP